MRMKVFSLAGWMVGLSLALATFATAEPVAVRFPETPGNRALVLRSLDGKTLAKGSVTVTVRDGRVTSQVVFHFTDGSVQDETDRVFPERRVPPVELSPGAEGPCISPDARYDAGYEDGAGRRASQRRKRRGGSGRGDADSVFRRRQRPDGSRVEEPQPDDRFGECFVGRSPHRNLAT